MDDQLKQRLLGAAILVALAVIFVPMLFDEKGDNGPPLDASGVPPLPPELQEREIPLPAMPEEEKQQAQGSGKAPERSGYRIIPLDEPPPSVAPKPSTAADAPAGQQKAEEAPVEFGADEGGAPDQVPTRDSPLAKKGRPSGGKPEPPAAGVEPRPAAAPAMPERSRQGGSPARPVQPSGGRASPAPRAPPGNAQPQQGAPTRRAPKSETSVREQPKAAAVHLSKGAAPPGSVPPARQPVPAATNAPVKAVELKVAASQGTGQQKTAAPSGPKSGASPQARGAATEPAPVAKPAKGSESAKSPARARTASEGVKSNAARQAAEPKTDTKPRAGSKPGAAPESTAARAVHPKPAGGATAKPAASTADSGARKKSDAAPEAKVAAASGAAAKPSAAGSAKPSAAPKAAEAAGDARSAVPSAWVVRAGSFSSESEAKSLTDRLKKQKFQAYVQKLSGENGVIYRVQVGPPLDKSRAEQTRKRLESTAGIHGALVPHR